jgi:hypothetical protein
MEQTEQNFNTTLAAAKIAIISELQEFTGGENRNIPNAVVVRVLDVIDTLVCDSIAYGEHLVYSKSV